MKIVSGFIGENPSPDFLSTICHEVNHLFEYDKGRKNRVDLYHRVVELLKSPSLIAKQVGRACYYTFQHEIDAFVHQFYGFLKQEEPTVLSFDKLLQYSEYRQVRSTYDFIISHKNNQEVIMWINYLGYDRNAFIKRLKHGKNKLFSKLKNAYDRFKYEVDNKSTEVRFGESVSQTSLYVESIYKF